MALLQIDTIHVVNRSPYLVLHARLGRYPPAWLEEALASGDLFETWAHEACFAPVGDVLRHRAYNRDQRSHWGLTNAQLSRERHRAHLDQLLAHIEGNGAVKSSDFERKGDGVGGGGWWGWKDEKRWLETLFAAGELMVARRDHFQRVYDLTARVAPQALAAEATGQAPTGPQVHQQFVERSLMALGIAQARWVNDYFRIKPRLKDADLDMLVTQGIVLRVDVAGWNAPAYVHHSHAALLEEACKGKLLASHTALLSPFDPVVWDRERASTLFGFDYRLECYTPEPKRQYGYFVLPILCRGELIGRLDAKAHRASGIFEVKALFAQPGLVWSDLQVKDVARALADVAVWHGTPEVTIAATQPAGLAVMLRSALATLEIVSNPR